MRIIVAGSVFSRLASARTLSRTNPRGCSKVGRIISCRLELNKPSRADKLNGADGRDLAFLRSGISRMTACGKVEQLVNIQMNVSLLILMVSPSKRAVESLSDEGA